MSLANHQGGTTCEASAPRCGWYMEEQARKAGLELIEVLPFDLEGSQYDPKRSFLDATFPCADPRVHILKIKIEGEPTGEAASLRTVLFNMASFALDSAFGWLGGGHQFVGPGSARRILERDSHGSKTHVIFCKQPRASTRFCFVFFQKRILCLKQ